MKCVMAHYGREVPGNPVAALTEWLRWVAEHMGEETHLTPIVKGSARGLKSGVAYRSDKHRRELDAEVTRGNVTQLTLTSMASEPEGYLAFEYDWTAVLDVAPDRFGPACVLVLESGRRQEDISVSHVLDAHGALARRMIGSGYGFASLMPQDFMPVGYAIGLACGGAPEEFVYDANSWRRYARKECDHVMRNVFGYNILNRAHLNIDIGGQRLEDWIRSSGTRGSLEPQGRDLFAWTFQEDVGQDDFLRWDYPPVVAVREQMKEHKLFPWQRLPGVR